MKTNSLLFLLIIVISACKVDPKINITSIKNNGNVIDVEYTITDVQSCGVKNLGVFYITPETLVAAGDITSFSNPSGKFKTQITDVFNDTLYEINAFVNTENCGRVDGKVHSHRFSFGCTLDTDTFYKIDGDDTTAIWMKISKQSFSTQSLRENLRFTDSFSHEEYWDFDFPSGAHSGVFTTTTDPNDSVSRKVLIRIKDQNPDGSYEIHTVPEGYTLYITQHTDGTTGSHTHVMTFCDIPLGVGKMASGSYDLYF